MSASRSPTDRPRVGLVAEQYLVGQAIRTALNAVGHEVALYRWPSGGRQLAVLRGNLGELDLDVGLGLCDLDSTDRIAQAVGLIGRSRLRWLVLTSAPEGPRWGALLDAGAKVVLPTSTPLDAVVTSIRAVREDRSLLDGAVRRRLIREWRDLADTERTLSGRMGSLTRREMEVLALLYEGRSVRAIADGAGVSEATVRSQVKSILRKLRVNTQLAAVATFRKLKDSPR